MFNPDNRGRNWYHGLSLEEFLIHEIIGLLYHISLVIYKFISLVDKIFSPPGY